MKILLIQPDSSQRMVGFTSMIRPEPLALEAIAAAIPEHEVRLLDLRVDPSLDSGLVSFGPDLVALTGYTTDVPRIRQICEHVKSFDREILTVVGGYHASLCPQDFEREYVDIVVVGEGEVTFRSLVEALEQGADLDTVDGIIHRQKGHPQPTRPREPVPRLDNLPYPARHLADAYRSQYHFHFWENPYLVETSRGCPYRCIFCAVWKFHQGRCRFKTAEIILDELKTLPTHLVCFADDNFLQDLRRAEKLYQLVKAEGLPFRYWVQARADSIAKRPDLIEKWAEIGLEAALVGFEKFREEDLERIDKRSSVRINERAAEVLQTHGVDIWGSFIVDPQWTRLDFDVLIDYVRNFKISFPIFTVLTPLPGTAFFQEKFKELRTLNYEFFDFLHSVLPTKLPLEEFYSNMARLYASTTMGLKELKMRVKSGRIPLSSLSRIREVLRDVTNPQAYIKSIEAV